MTNPPEVVDDDTTTRRPRRTRRALVAAVTCLAVAAAALAVSRFRSDPAVRVTAGHPAGTATAPDPAVPASDGAEAPAPSPPVDMTNTTGPATTTTTDPASTTTTSATTAESGAKVMQADDGSWRLEQVDRAGHRCLQLIAGATRATDLLCNASPPSGLWGGYAAVSTPLGPMVVALVDPAVTGVETLMGQGFTGKVAADPADSALHYAAGVLRDVGIFLKGGDNTLGRTAINSSPGPHPAPDVVTTAPYGARPGYRKAGYTGFFWGGNEEVGFYDAPAADGTRCLLWRRFGGNHEGVVLDVCPGATDNRFPLARLLSEAPMATDLVRPAVLVDAPRVTGWSYSWDAAPSSPTGASGPLPPEYGQVFADPAQPGRFFLGYFPGAIGRQGTELTVTAYDGPTVVGTVTVTAPTG